MARERALSRRQGGARAKGQGGRNASLPGIVVGGLRRLLLFGQLVGRFVPRRLPRDSAALLVATLAILLTVALYGQKDETGAISYIAEGCRRLLGRGAVAVPLGFGWAALELLFSRSWESTRQRAVGLILYTLGALALLDTRGVSQGGPAGGVLGAGVAALLRLIGGDIGLGVFAFVLGLIGSTLAAGVELRVVVAQLIAGLCRLRGVIYRLVARDRSVGGAASLVQHTAAVTQVQQKEARQKEENQIPKIMSSPRPRLASGRVKPAMREPRQSESDLAESGAAAGTVAVEHLPVRLPDVTRLRCYEASLPNPAELQRKAQVIQETLANFRVDAWVREIYPGPAVTLFTLEPGPGVKVRRITELVNDLALALAASAIRIEAPVPGMARVGIEVPNDSISTVGLREVLESPAFQRSHARLPLALGRDVHGEYVVADLTRMPHLLIAGATGSGKSVALNSIIATFLLTRRPDELQMLLIDPKKVELTGYDGVPHLKCPVVTDMGLVVGALRRVLQEMERRYELFAQLGVRNLDGYRLRREDDPSLEALPYLVVIIDELADLMLTAPDEVETMLVRIAQMARATGIHLLIATQRPSVDVLTGLIKANVPARIAFAVTSQTDSRVILDMPGAERLLGRGDMLYLPPDAARPVRVQGSFIDDRDLEYVVGHWRQLYPVPNYDPSWLELEAQPAEVNRAEDPLLEEARRLVQELGSASTSLLQRRLRIGYNRAARLMEQLEAEGVVGPAEGARRRVVYLAED